MFVVLFSSRSRNLFVRGLHFAKQGPRSCAEDIIFKAVCVNVWEKKWKFLDQMRSSMTNSMISRVLQAVQSSPLILLEFYRRIGGQEAILDSLESCCIVIHVMVGQRKYDEAVCLLTELMTSRGHLPLDVLKALIKSFDSWCPPSNVFDALIRCCIQIGATEGAYKVIKKLRMENYWISVHAWNNYLNHLLKIGDVGRFWMVYKEMVSYGYWENVNTFNLLIYVLCKECKLAIAFSVFCRMLKMGIGPKVVGFNVLIAGDCRADEIDLAVNVVKKMGATSKGYSFPTITTCATLVNGYLRHGYLEEAFTRGNIAERGLIYKSGVYNIAFSCSEMVERGLVPNSVVYKTLVHRLYMEQDSSGASLLLSNMMEIRTPADQFIYSIIVKGLRRNGRINDALKICNLMVEKNIEGETSLPSIFTSDISGIEQMLRSISVR